MMKRYELFLVALAAMLFVFPQPAMAYLGPGSGSIVWQVVVGGLLAVGYTIRIYWSKVRSFFSKKADTDNPPTP
jgi:hypothetical protein